MTPAISELVNPVISYALDLKERLDMGEQPDLETEQRQLMDRLRSDGESRRLVDYSGDGSIFLGARYALTCWIDELFIVYSPWAEVWKERILEVALYGSRDRAWKFWDQVEIALRRPNAPRASTPPGLDAIETYFLCVMLGFRGKYLENPGKVKEFVEEMRPQVARVGAWPSPRELGVATNVHPLSGRAALARAVSIYGGLSFVLLMILLIVLSALGYLGG
jgi:type VI secretion system protein ImpK